MPHDDGYTAYYLVKGAGNTILVYNVGYQHRSDDPGFKGNMNEGHRLEYRQMLERLRVQLGVDPLL